MVNKMKINLGNAIKFMIGVTLIFMGVIIIEIKVSASFDVVDCLTNVFGILCIIYAGEIFGYMELGGNHDS